MKKILLLLMVFFSFGAFAAEHYWRDVPLSEVDESDSLWVA